MSPAGRSKLALLCIAVAAFAAQRSATLPWGMLDTADGRRVEVSPIGVTQVSPAAQPATEGQCRWWPTAGNPDLCAVPASGAGAYASLRRVYPLMSAALWLSILALFTQVLQRPRSLLVRVAATALAALAAGTALTVFFGSAGGALVVLGGQQPVPSTPGAWMAALAVLLAAGGAWLHWLAQRATGRGD